MQLLLCSWLGMREQDGPTKDPFVSAVFLAVVVYVEHSKEAPRAIVPDQ